VLDSLEAHARRLEHESQQEASARAAEPQSPLDGHQLRALADRDPGPWIASLKDYLLQQVKSGALNPEDIPAAENLARQWLLSNPDEARE
jgi:hypothetical protein